MKYLEILRAKLAELNETRSAALAEMEAITEAAATENRSALNETEEAAFVEARGKLTELDADIAKTEERVAELEEDAKRSAKVADAPQVVRKVDPVNILEDRGATPMQLRDAALKQVEERAEFHDIDANLVGTAGKLIRKHAESDPEWARGVLARATPAYESAFEKLIRANGGFVVLTPDEQRAIVVGTNTSGGFLVPTVIDPTLIYTNAGSDNIIRQISRTVTLTGDSNAVNVISSAGVTASWDPELTEVSDDSPEVARPNIPIHKAAAFVVASIEATQDMGGFFGSELRGLFEDAKDRLEGTAFAMGSGTNQPTGIFTALDANTNVELTTTTAATVGEVDLHAVYRSLGSRWRRRSTWLANPLFTLAIKRLGTSVSSAYSGDLREAPTGTVLGRPFEEAEDAPSAQTTTQLDNVLILGDFSNYVIADKPASMAVEYIPHVFGATNGRPIGARGWYAYWRTGADSVNDLAFRLLQDKTSA